MKANAEQLTERNRDKAVSFWYSMFSWLAQTKLGQRIRNASARMLLFLDSGFLGGHRAGHNVD